MSIKRQGNLNLHTTPAKPVLRKAGNQTELLRYFKLRHEVYTSMSYLSPLVEGVQSRLDIDWFDTRSIHIGAFEQYLGHEELIGTARLITTEPLHPQHPHWTRQLAGLDPVLERLVNEGAVQAMLPVFQSQDLEGELHQAIRGGILVGELSRVIVHPNCRGAGLSQRLVHKVIELAEKARVGSLYLECLPIHEGLYQRVGFSTLPVRGKVYVVNKTMMVMRLMLSSGVPALKVLPTAQPQ
jgi:predicted GNAT family N-acyltransferase